MHAPLVSQDPGPSALPDNCGRLFDFLASLVLHLCVSSSAGAMGLKLLKGHGQCNVDHEIAEQVENKRKEAARACARIVAQVVYSRTWNRLGLPCVRAHPRAAQRTGRGYYVL